MTSIPSMVSTDITQREALEVLPTLNGVDSILDAYHTVLDLALYLKQVIASGGVVGRHGAEDCPVDPAVRLTAGQLITRILDADEKQRIEICDRLMFNSEKGYRCLSHDHVGRIEDLERRIKQLSKALVRSMGGLPIPPDSDVALNAKWEVARDDTASRL